MHESRDDFTDQGFDIRSIMPPTPETRNDFDDLMTEMARRASYADVESVILIVGDTDADHMRISCSRLVERIAIGERVIQTAGGQLSIDVTSVAGPAVVLTPGQSPADPVAATNAGFFIHELAATLDEAGGDWVRAAYDAATAEADESLDMVADEAINADGAQAVQSGLASTVLSLLAASPFAVARYRTGTFAMMDEDGFPALDVDLRSGEGLVPEAEVCSVTVVGSEAGDCTYVYSRNGLGEETLALIDAGKMYDDGFQQFGELDVTDAKMAGFTTAVRAAIGT